ncbi:MAG TPA: mechanosensitive ion channel family protein [Candidatus Binatia bacterium]
MAADNGEGLLPLVVRQLAHLIGLGLEQLPGTLPLSEWKYFYPDLWLHAATSLVLLVCWLFAHGLIFTFIRRKVDGRCEKHGGEDIWVIVAQAVVKPLKFAFWIFGFYLAALPLLLLLDSDHPLYSIRLLIDRLCNLLLFAALYWLFYRSIDIAENRLRTWARGARTEIQSLAIPLIVTTLRAIVPVAAVTAGLPLLGLPPAYDAIVTKASSLFILGVVSWLLFRIVAVGERFILNRYDVSRADNLKARQIYTQVHILKRTLHVVITVFMLAAGLMMFEQVRSLGASVLASAGVIGIIVGFAAQRTIANLFAGFQLAMTQPIRMDDVVIVENEWGRIEEITLTYVVVRIWDLRRLIVPLSYFIERPFQNWTRAESEILGTVFLYTDYRVPVDAIREALNRIVAQSPNWDGKVCGLQVTNASDRAVELRALASAADASKAWDLRCEIREKLIDFVQQNYPDSLPRIRAEMHADPPRDDREQKEHPSEAIHEPDKKQERPDR